MVDAEWAEGVDHAGGGGAALPGAPGGHREGGAVRIRTSSPSLPTTRSQRSSIPTMASASWSPARSCSISPRRQASFGRRTFPTKWRVVEWLMWQMGGAGPFLGQVHHFVKFNPGKSAYAEERYTREAKRLWSRARQAPWRSRLRRGRLFHRRYCHLAVDFPVRNGKPSIFDDYPNVKRWYMAIADRPAVQGAGTCRPATAASRCRERRVRCSLARGQLWQNAAQSPPDCQLIGRLSEAGGRRECGGPQLIAHWCSSAYCLWHWRCGLDERLTMLIWLRRKSSSAACKVALPGRSSAASSVVAGVPEQALPSAPASASSPARPNADANARAAYESQYYATASRGAWPLVLQHPIVLDPARLQSRSG